MTHALSAEPVHGVFANAQVVSRSWYPACRSARLRRSRLLSFELLDRRLALYRDSAGHAHALDARCPHLGADLTLGTVEGDVVRCSFHGWCFGADGVCCNAPGHRVAPRRRARAYPVEERWGFVWVFNGQTPLFPLPSPGHTLRRYRVFALPRQRLACHPHLVLANGLDLAHYERLHGMRFADEPTLDVQDHSVTVTLRGRPVSSFWRFVSGARRRDIVARFSTIGGSLAWTTVLEPVPFHVLFTGRPDRAGGCVTQTIFLFPSAFGADWVRAFGLMATLLHDDRRVLNTIDFRPHFDEADAPLRAFAGVVDALGAW